LIEDSPKRARDNSNILT